MKFDAPAFKKLEKVQHLARRVEWKIEPRAPLSPSELLKFLIFSYRVFAGSPALVRRHPVIILNSRCRPKTAGKSTRAIMAHTGHRSVTMVREAE
jgi:hypothetical protein